MPNPFINATLLTVTGAAIGFTYHVLNRGNQTLTDTNGTTTDVPAWEKSLQKAASLPWHYLHPAGQFVTTENLDRVLRTARTLRNQHVTGKDTPATTEPSTEVPSPAPTAEEDIPADPQPEPASRPLGQPKAPGSREETLAHFSGLLDQAKNTATDVAKRYQEDPEFRATVNQAAQIGSSAIATLRKQAKQAARRTGGTPRA